MNIDMHKHMHLCVLSPQSCPANFRAQWTVILRDLLSKRFSRQEFWSVLPCPPPEIFLAQRLCPHLLKLLCCRQILYLSVTVESLNICICTLKAQIELKKQNECLHTDQKWKRHSKFQWNERSNIIYASPLESSDM